MRQLFPYKFQKMMIYSIFAGVVWVINPILGDLLIIGLTIRIIYHP